MKLSHGYKFYEEETPIDYIFRAISEGAPSFVFYDLESYQYLFDKNVIIPGETILRVDTGDVGGNYSAHTRDEVVGLEANCYAGMPGTHHLLDLLDISEEFSVDGIYLPSKDFTPVRDCLIFPSLDYLETYLDNRQPHSEETKQFLERVRKV